MMAKTAGILHQRFVLGFGFWLAVAVTVTKALLTYKTVIRGNDISIPCLAYTTISPSVIPSSVVVEWQKDSIPLVDSRMQMINGRFRLDTGTQYSLTISSAAMSEDGVYTCRADGEPVSTVTSSSVSMTTSASLTTLATILTMESNLNLTVEEPIPPGDPVARVITKNSIDVAWAASNGPVESYQVLYRKEPPTSADAPFSPSDPPGLESSLLVEGLDVFSEYSFLIEARYRGDYTKMSGMSSFKTAPGTPTTAPQDVTAEAISATSVRVTWTAPPTTSLNGDLVGHKIMLSPGDDVITVISTETVALVDNLHPFTNYTISVAVFNNALGIAAIGPSSRPVDAQTFEAVHKAPTGLRSITQEQNYIMLFWDKPVPLHSELISFNVYYRKRGETAWSEPEIVGDIQYHLLNGLDIFTQYEIQVTSVNSLGEGPPSLILTETTDTAAPSSPVNVTVTDMGSGQAKVSWMVPEVFYKSIDSYTIKYWESGKNATMDAVEVDKLWRIVENLKGGVKYEVTVRAATKSIANTDLHTGNPSEVVVFTIDKPVDTTAESPVTTLTPNSTVGMGINEDGPPLGTIVGVVFAMIYVLALVVAGLTYMFIKMRKKDRLEFEKQENGVPPAFAKPDELEEPPIPLSKFEAHVIANHADSDGGFATEYEDIQHVSTAYPALSSTDVSLKHKNRYTNIVAYDHTRVKLSILPNQPLSDYINASYIDGYGRQKAYIAAQGPLKTTFEDFWRMVWEQHTIVIVMITKLEERGRRKCDRYWPAKGMPERYGEFEVTLETKEKYASHVVRTFLLKHKHRKHGKAPERRITQFHYTDWPDHGVPSYTIPVLAFVQKSSATNPPDAGPMVVHCSAGVGRTGTYIVIDSMLKQMQKEHKVNVFGFLKRIRTQRNYLVQTEEQYVFIHDVLLEWLKAGNTKVQACDLRQYTDRMTLPDEHGKVLLNDHFKFITHQKIRDYEFAKARHVLNRGKNRKNELLPIERNRVSISGVAGQESSDYINASFLQGYRRNKEFIVTQYPMKETMCEFWRMLWEGNSTTIVMLTDKDEEDTPIYWPTNKGESLTIGTMKVTLCDEEHSNMSFITREFLLSCSQDEDQLTVKQYHCSYWPDSCSPLHTAFDLIYALEERSTMLAQINKDVVGPITVHDRFGGRTAGTFCALFTLHQELTIEGSVDVYKTIKLYANKRPRMFTAKDEYHFVYRALQSVYLAEQQMKSFKVQSMPRLGNETENNKDWQNARYMTAVPESSNLRQMSDSARNSSLDSDNWYRARSQTLASTGTQRNQRPLKFWHRRTKSEKRKPTNLSITNTNALEVTPPNDSPKDSNPEVYDIAEKYDKGLSGTEVDASMDPEVRLGNGTPSTVSDTTVVPDIHLNLQDHLQNDKHNSVHMEDGETIALMGHLAPGANHENTEMSTPDYRFGGSTKFKSRSRESLGNHSTKSEETRM
ncbi:receptor-type tyrosine-protein phosphatase delta-like isoform X3 [Asterias rubens]|uniref:receptor-type tyrosine-protein phosphatase delta-like isoform X3 n=1 Tax=Asterias rubens TaxID=7604 RepID=UPI0014553FF3|nr:receptor-type tyrosine-protein phosphatase delta-like isoform X3 [Asterias rubens]